MKALFAGDPTLPRAFDRRGLDEALTFWSPVAPRTVFAGIDEVRPGTVRPAYRVTVYSADWGKMGGL